jgi:hypothetical protein
VVNSENLIKSLNQPVKASPYLDCLKFIAKASFCLIEEGESQFIDFIHAESITQETIKENKALELISQFDFCIGSPVARQLLTYLMLKDFHHFSNYLLKEMKGILILNAKRGINSINQIPSSTVKASRSLILIDRMEKELDNYNHIDTLFTEISKKVSIQKPLKKEDLYAPLKFWEEDSIKNNFYTLLNRLEGATNAYFYFLSLKDEKIKLNILSIKETLLESTSQEIYNKSIFISKLIHLIIKNQENHKKVLTSETKMFENKVFIERLGIQLSKRNEGIEEIKNLQLKMNNLINSDIHFNELIDEEIHTIHSAISKENITRARLEMRLNDTEYPLSVAYREYITIVLQHLED